MGKIAKKNEKPFSVGQERFNNGGNVGEFQQFIRRENVQDFKQHPLSHLKSHVSFCTAQKKFKIP